MNRSPVEDPLTAAPGNGNPAVSPIDTVIVPRAVDLGDFQVLRALSSDKRQMVGLFIFFGQFGPAGFLTGNGIDVRPHPYIGLASVTYPAFSIWLH